MGKERPGLGGRSCSLSRASGRHWASVAGQALGTQTDKTLTVASRSSPDGTVGTPLPRPSTHSDVHLQIPVAPTSARFSWAALWDFPHVPPLLVSAPQQKLKPLGFFPPVQAPEARHKPD